MIYACTLCIVTKLASSYSSANYRLIMMVKLIFINIYHKINNIIIIMHVIV